MGFPWDDVETARNDSGLQAGHDPEVARRLYGNQVWCPECSRGGDELTWFYFRSPPWTWTSLCGRSGWLAVCDAYRAQAAFLLDCMS